MDLINLQLYPLDKPESLEYKKCIEKLRFEMSQTGVAACPNFLKNEAVFQAVQDTEKVKTKAWLTDTMRNIYLDSGDEKYPDNHIRNRLTHCMVRSGFLIHFTLLLSKSSTLISRETFRFFGDEKLAKMLRFWAF